MQIREKHRRVRFLPQIDALERRLCLSATFTAETDLTGVNSPAAVAVGDFNNDGAPDIAVAGTDPATNLKTVAIYLNNGASFSGAKYYDLPGASSVFALAATAIASASNTSLAVTDPVDATVILLPGNGDGTFGTPVTTSYGTAQSAGTSPTAYLVSGDFASGTPGLVVTDPADHKIVPMTSQSDGSYTLGTPITSTDPTFSPQQIVAADFNADGNLDIAFANGDSPMISVANGDGNGGFAAFTDYTVSGIAGGLAVGDLTTDGSPDIVATIPGTSTSDTINVLLNTSGTFAAPTELNTTFDAPGPVAVADINGDGTPDIVTIDSSGTVNYFHGNDDGTFQSPVAEQTNLSSATSLDTGIFAGYINAGIAIGGTMSGGSSGGVAVLNGVTPPDYSVKISGALTPSGVVGQKIKLSQTIAATNTSENKLAGSTTVALALATSPDDFSGATVLVSKKHGGKISSGKGFTQKLSATKLPVTLSPGTYYAIAEVTDPDGGIASASSTGTITIAAPQIDLTGSFKKVPATAGANRAIAATITVANLGNVAAAGSLPISVYASGDGTLDGTSTGLVGSGYKINIKPGKTTTLRLKNLIAPSAGQYYLIVVLDPNGTLGDVNSSNNTFTTSSQITVS